MERKGRKDRKAKLFFASVAVFAFFVPRAVQPFRAASPPQADEVKSRLVLRIFERWQSADAVVEIR